MPGLRDFLLSMNEGANAWSDAAKSATDLRTSLDKEAMIKELPDAIQKKDWGRVTQIQAKLSPAGMDDLIKQMMPKQVDPSKAPLDEKGLGLIYQDPKIVGYLKDKPLETQNKFAEFKSKAEGTAIKQEGLKLTKEAEIRRGGSNEAKQVDTFAVPLEKIERNVDDAVSKISAAVNAFRANPNKATRQALAVAMARGAGDTGVLSNQDLNNYNLSTIASDFDKLVAYASDTPDDSVPPSVSQSLINMAEAAVKQSEGRKKMLLGKAFENRVPTFNTFLMDKDGVKHQTLKNWEKKLGMEVTKDADGNIVIKKGTTTLSGAKAELAAAIGAMTNEAEKKKLISALNQWGDQEIPEATVNNFRARIKKAGG